MNNAEKQSNGITEADIAANKSFQSAQPPGSVIEVKRLKN
jgi:hypothetical protein